MVSLQVAVLALTLSGTGQTVLLDFYADWCGPCRAMEPTVQALANAGFPVRKVNIDQDRPLAAKYRVQSIPCYVMLVDGREIDRVVGGTSLSRLERMCKAGAPAQSAPGTPPSALAGGPPRGSPPMAVGPPGSSLPLSGVQPLPADLSSGFVPPPPISPTGSGPNGSAVAPEATALVAASVRLRIEDPNGHSCGSGTIVDARGGQALILTCGHIFRDSGGKGRIEVDLFGPNSAQTVAGRLVSYDLTRDVGLVSIHTQGPVAVTRVASEGYRPKRGDPVVSVGCNNGNQPSPRQSQITSLDKFLGPPNIQVAGLPVEGRSGGGLFSADAQVIGVCNAADPESQEGLFAALGAIYAELDRAGLSFVYKGGREAPATQSLAAVDPPAMPKQMPRSDGSPAAPTTPIVPAMAIAQPTRLAPGEQAALDEIHRRLQEGAEVVCVIRNRQDPSGKSEVIMLDKVSPQFLQQLTIEGQSRDSRHLTSLEIPRTLPPPAARQ